MSKEKQYWRLRKDLSEDGKKISLKDLEIKCQEYIDFCLDNPLLETDYRGKDLQMVTIPKMRAMTQWGLYQWLGIGESTWHDWKKNERYAEVIARVENLFKAYKFEGAAADLLNPNIIARDLGLADRQEQTVTKKNLPDWMDEGES